MTQITTVNPLRDVEGKARLMVGAVRNALQSPAKGAALRRGVGKPPTHPSMRASHSIVARYTEGADEATEWAFYAVAGYIAAQPRQARDADRAAAGAAADPGDGSETPAQPSTAMRQPLNLGAVLAKAVSSGKLNADTTEERLHLLCRQNLDGLHRQLPRLISYLRTSGVDVDWVKLTVDLSRWKRHRDQVAKQWLQAYHRTLARTTDQMASAANESE